MQAYHLRKLVEFLQNTKCQKRHKRQKFLLDLNVTVV